MLINEPQYHNNNPYVSRHFQNLLSKLNREPLDIHPNPYAVKKY